MFPADPFDEDLLRRIARHLESGGLLGYPTETVYGLGAEATAEGVEQLRALKGRGGDKPFLLLVPGGHVDASAELESNPGARALAARFWPGPLTLVLPDPKGRYPQGTRGEHEGVAVRVSSHPFVSALMSVFRRPLLSTSGNLTGLPPARSAEELEHAFSGRPGGDRLWIVDGGELNDPRPSTIVDCTNAVPRVLRVGRVSTAELSTVAPDLQVPDPMDQAGLS